MNQSLYTNASTLALLTVLYNLAEGIIAVVFGLKDGSLTLFGFGVDSFIEMVSAFGIAHMVSRIRKAPESSIDRFEKTALTITGISFYALTLGLVVTGVQNLFTQAKPETTVAGIVLSVVSIGTMLFLMRGKLKVGRALHSDPIIADAHCTKVCIYMSIVLLAASGLYELTRIGYVDVAGSFALAYLSFKEGRESLQKAARNAICASDDE